MVVSYSDFEQYMGESISPSMFEYMSYYYETICANAEEAVHAYYELPWQERERLHIQTLDRLEETLREVPFDPTSPIYAECERMLHEEECWRGGWEMGESDTEGPRYDELDE